MSKVLSEKSISLKVSDFMGGVSESNYVKINRFAVWSTVPALLGMCVSLVVVPYLKGRFSESLISDLNARRISLLASIHRYEDSEALLKRGESGVRSYYEFERSIAELPRVLSEVAAQSTLKVEEVMRYADTGVEKGNRITGSSVRGVFYRCRLRGEFSAILRFLRFVSEANTGFVVTESLLRNPDWPRFNGALEAFISLELRIKDQ